jgi:hypothetical protein
MPSRIAVARSVCAQNPPETIGATRAKESWQLAARPFFRLSSQTAPGAQPRGRLTGVWQTVRPCRHVVHRISLQLGAAWWRGGLARSRQIAHCRKTFLRPVATTKDTPVQVDQRDRVTLAASTVSAHPRVRQQGSDSASSELARTCQEKPQLGKRGCVVCPDLSVYRNFAYPWMHDANDPHALFKIQSTLCGTYYFTMQTLMNVMIK